MSNDYVYVFSVNGVCWSSETKESLMKRVVGDNIELVAEFLESDPPAGSFIVLDNQDMIFRSRKP